MVQRTVALGLDYLFALVYGEVKIGNDLAILPWLSDGIVVGDTVLVGEEGHNENSRYENQ